MKSEKPHTTWMRLQLVAKILELVNDFGDPTLSTISKPELGKSFRNYYRGPEIRAFIFLILANLILPINVNQLQLKLKADIKRVVNPSVANVLPLVTTALPAVDIVFITMKIINPWKIRQLTL